MVSKACIVGTYQTKLELLAGDPEVELFLLVPPDWRGPEGTTALERRHVRGYEMIVTPMRLDGHFHVHYYPELPRWIKKIQPDIVHMDEEPYNLATYLGLRAARRAGARGIFFTWQNLRRRYPPPFRNMEQAVFRMADHAIAGSRAAADVLRWKGYGGPLTVIPQFGVDTRIFTPPARREESDALRIGYAGRLVPEKGVGVLLEALAGLDRPWHAYIAGEGPLRQTLQAEAEALGIAHSVTFLGRVPSAEMPAFLGGLDVLVLPSLSRPNWTEQFGRVLVEAMACEVAVVGSQGGEIPHVIGEAGLTFPEGDAGALRDVLAQLGADPDRRRELGRAGRQRVLQNFSQERVAGDTLSVYRAVMGEG